jgi:hypothetical protein
MQGLTFGVGGEKETGLPRDVQTPPKKTLCYAQTGAWGSKEQHSIAQRIRAFAMHVVQAPVEASGCLVW